MQREKSKIGRAATTIAAVIYIFSIFGCSKEANSDTLKDPVLLGPYTCTAKPGDQRLLGLVKMAPSFLFLRDGTAEYTLRNGNLPSVTWYGNYRIDGDTLLLNYDKSRIGNMNPDPDNLSHKFKILKISRDGFSITQVYNSKDAENLWEMNCLR